MSITFIGAVLFINNFINLLQYGCQKLCQLVRA